MTALYAYGIVPASIDPAGAPGGIDEGPVATVANDDLAALVTAIDERAYDPAAVETQSRDVEWLGVRAAAHDRVLTWAADRVTVIPLPLFSLFRDASGVRQMLAARSAELRRTLHEIGDAREYTVRVYRLDRELGASVGGRSRAVADLETRAAAASPGQRYLLERKLAQTRREEIERIGQETADEVSDALAAIARASTREPVVAQAGSVGVAVLNASFLVGTHDVEAFRAAVTRLVGTRGPEGFRFEFTGPWAPYHFVRPAEGPATASLPGTRTTG